MVGHASLLCDFDLLLRLQSLVSLAQTQGFRLSDLQLTGESYMQTGSTANVACVQLSHAHWGIRENPFIDLAKNGKYSRRGA